MNLIIVNDYAYCNGGASGVALDNAKLLAKQGHNVTLFTAVGPIDDNLTTINNLKIICLGQYDILNDPNRIRASIRGLWNYKSAKEFGKLLKRYDPDDTVIHIHSLQKAITTSIIPVAKKKGFRILYHLHDYGIVCPNMGFYNYQKQSICTKKPLSIQCICCNCDSRKYIHKLWRVVRQFVQMYMGGLPGKVDGSVFVSNFSRKVLGKYISKGQVIPNPMNITNRYKVDASLNKYVLYIGRLSPEKNPVTLAEAARDLNVPVVFIGSGICMERIQRVNPSAICTGWLDKEKMGSYISQARYLVFPSLWYETQGLVVAEAMAYGIPVVVSDSCAATDFVSPNVNGLFFSNGEIESLKEAMEKMRDDKFVAVLSENAYKLFGDTSEKYTTDIERYYSNLLAKK